MKKIVHLIIFIAVIIIISNKSLSSSDKIEFLKKIYNQDSLEIILEDIESINIRNFYESHSKFNFIEYEVYFDSTNKFLSVELDFFNEDIYTDYFASKLKLEIEKLFLDNKNFFCNNVRNKRYIDLDSNIYVVRYNMYSKCKNNITRNKYHCN